MSFHVFLVSSWLVFRAFSTAICRNTCEDSLRWSRILSNIQNSPYEPASAIMCLIVPRTPRPHKPLNTSRLLVAITFTLMHPWSVVQTAPFWYVVALSLFSIEISIDGLSNLAATTSSLVISISALPISYRRFNKYTCILDTTKEIDSVHLLLPSRILSDTFPILASSSQAYSLDSFIFQ